MGGQFRLVRLLSGRVKILAWDYLAIDDATRKKTGRQADGARAGSRIPMAARGDGRERRFGLSGQGGRGLSGGKSV
jgi:hypothetical protein